MHKNNENVSFLHDTKSQFGVKSHLQYKVTSELNFGFYSSLPKNQKKNLLFVFWYNFFLKRKTLKPIKKLESLRPSVICCEIK